MIDLFPAFSREYSEYEHDRFSFYIGDIPIEMGIVTYRQYNHFQIVTQFLLADIFPIKWGQMAFGGGKGWKTCDTPSDGTGKGADQSPKCPKGHPGSHTFQFSALMTDV